jgi:hypothetical protein
MFEIVFEVMFKVVLKTVFKGGPVQYKSLLKSLPVKKKGQVAMEYVMIYGWAILAVMVIMGFIINYANINPADFMGEECNFDVGLVCNDFAIYESGEKNIALSVTNGFSKSITITNIAFSGGFKHTAKLSPVIEIPPTDTKLIEINAGIEPFKNEKVDITVEYYYSDTSDDFTYTLNGYLKGSSIER